MLPLALSACKIDDLMVNEPQYNSSRTVCRYDEAGRRICQTEPTQNVYQNRSGQYNTNHNTGHYRPEVVRVVIQGGTAKIDGKISAYRPISFDIADGETRQVRIERATKNRAEMFDVSYNEGLLIIDDRLGQIVYDRSWENTGRTYQLNTGGTADFRSASVTVTVVGRNRR